MNETKVLIEKITEGIQENKESPFLVINRN